MKKHLPLLSLTALLAILSLSGCHGISSVGKRPLPISEEQLRGVWVGLTEDDAFYFRVELGARGEGSCAYASAGDRACLLRIRDWAVGAQSTIRIPLEPSDHDIEGLREIAGTAHGAVMYVAVAGTHWHRRVHLKRESEVESLARIVKQRMTEGKRGAP